MRVCVFCGSAFGNDPAFTAAAVELGHGLAARGDELVYGGGHVGLMGVVADAALADGGIVTGVITDHLVAGEVAHIGLTTLEVVPSMHERKARLVALADAVIVLPGGFGTFDETFEVLTWNQLGLVHRPVVFVDIGGFFAPVFELIEHCVEHGFVRPHNARLARRAPSVAAALAELV